MEGIKETKELLTFVIELAEALDRSLEDGDIGFGDLTNLVSAMMASNAAFDNISKIPSELKDLDETEAAELYAFVKDELDFRSEKTEEILECALEIGLKTFQLVQLIREEPAPAAPATPTA